MTDEDRRLIDAAFARAEALGLRRKKGDTSPPKPPGLLRQAVNFAAAATRHVLHGLPVVSDEERERRLTICRACEHFIAETEKCRKCGCAMKLKASWEMERCPLNPPKW